MNRIEEYQDAITAAQDIIKTSKEQVKRLEKIEILDAEFHVNNQFGFEMLNSLTCTFPAKDYFNKLIEDSENNIKKYKKIIKALEKVEELLK